MLIILFTILQQMLLLTEEKTYRGACLEIMTNAFKYRYASKHAAGRIDGMFHGHI